MTIHDSTVQISKLWPHTSKHQPEQTKQLHGRAPVIVTSTLTKVPLLYLYSGFRVSKPSSPSSLFSSRKHSPLSSSRGFADMPTGQERRVLLWSLPFHSFRRPLNALWFNSSPVSFVSAMITVDVIIPSFLLHQFHQSHMKLLEPCPVFMPLFDLGCCYSFLFFFFFISHGVVSPTVVFICFMKKRLEICFMPLFELGRCYFLFLTWVFCGFCIEL